MAKRWRVLWRRLWSWRSPPPDGDTEAGLPDRSGAAARGRFWAEFRDGQREADERAARRAP